jgi:hypothetical protein
MTVFTTLNIVAFAPRQRARVRMAVATKLF